MSDLIAQLVDTAAAWDGIEVRPHRFGGQEFRWGRVEIGHVHRNGMVDIPFTRHSRNELLAAGLAGPHHLLADSGWITTYLRNEQDLARVTDLLRLSFLQKRDRRENSEVLNAELATLRARLGMAAAY